MMEFTKGDQQRFRRKSKWFASFALVFLLCTFIPTPLGSLFTWITVGAAVYFAFLSVYNLVLSSMAKYPYRKRKPTQQDLENREHIQFHLPIVIAILLGGLLLAVVIIFFFT